MGIRIRVPEEALSSDLALVPEDIYSAELTDISVKISSSSKQPVAWFIWTLGSDPTEPIDEELYPDLPGSTIGQKILDSCSLQEQALWRLNDVFKSITGENLPTEEDFSLQEFGEMLKERCVGFSGMVQVVEEPGEDEQPRNRIDRITQFEKKKRSKKK